MIRIGPNLIYALLAIAISACAGATTSAPQMENAPVASGRPTQIVVYPFATSTAEVTLNQGIGAKLYRDATDENSTAEQNQLAQATAQNICMQVATSLASNGWNAACQPRGTAISGSNTLIVDGIFTDISQGNRAQRMIIGLGLGASVVDTQVTLYQYSNGNSAPLMDFTTHADSGKMPGVGITGPAGAAAGGATAAATLGVNVAAGGVKSVTSSTGYLVDQSAKQIVSQANNYFSQQGWNPTSPSS